MALLDLFRRRAYKVFTKSFDLEVSGADLDQFLGATIEARAGTQVHRALTLVTQVWTELQPFLSELKEEHSHQDGSTAVSLLIDHSNSMRGQNAFIAFLFAECLTKALRQFELAHEVLGFTTVTWDGGQSKTDWLARGLEPRPGRLCDLLHIVYKSFEEPISDPPTGMAHMFNGDLLKENVDGEALLWAADRLQATKASKKFLFVISDGVPMDDTTAYENGVNYLRKHLVHVLNRLSKIEDLDVFAIALDDYPKSLYRQSYRISESRQVSEAVQTVLRHLVSKCRARI